MINYTNVHYFACGAGVGLIVSLGLYLLLRYLKADKPAASQDPGSAGAILVVRLLPFIVAAFLITTETTACLFLGYALVRITCIIAELLAARQKPQ